MTDMQIVSDLHIEYQNDSVPDPLDLITPTADILTLAGDIGSLYKFTQLSTFLRRLCRHFDTVLYIPGNHEYYTINDTRPETIPVLKQRLQQLQHGTKPTDQDISNGIIDFQSFLPSVSNTEQRELVEQKLNELQCNRKEDTMQDLDTLCELFTQFDSNHYDIGKNFLGLLGMRGIPKLYILDRCGVQIDDVCIVGCTLWSKPEVNVPPYIVRVHDMTTHSYEAWHNRDLKYILKMIEYCQEESLRLVVVTHHCPTYKVLDGARKRTKFLSLYASKLDAMLSSDKVHTWVCGHIHKNFDFRTENGTRVVGNQRGKPKDLSGEDYSKKFVLNL
jgi:predicted phosphohydrolase